MQNPLQAPIEIRVHDTSVHDDDNDEDNALKVQYEVVGSNQILVLPSGDPVSTFCRVCTAHVRVKVGSMSIYRVVPQVVLVHYFLLTSNGELRFSIRRPYTGPWDRTLMSAKGCVQPDGPPYGLVGDCSNTP